MNEKARALHVLEEADAEAGAFVGAFDEPGKIGDDERAAELATFLAGRTKAVRVDDTEIGFERRERIARYFRTRRGNNRNECGFSGVGKTDEADVGEKL